MPRMWSSPGPLVAATLLMPSRTTRRDWFACSGARIRDSVNSVAEAPGVGDPVSWMVPSGLKKTTKLFGGACRGAPVARDNGDMTSSSGRPTATLPAPRRHRAAAETERPHGRTSHVERLAPVQEGVGLGQREPADRARSRRSKRSASAASPAMQRVGVGLGAAVGVAEPLRAHAALHVGAAGASLRPSSSDAVEVPRDDRVGLLDAPLASTGWPFSHGAEHARAVEVLEAKPDRIHQAVAGRAGVVGGMLREALARGQRRAEIRRLDLNSGGRRRQLLAEQLLAHELAAMDGRGLVRPWRAG